MMFPANDRLIGSVVWFSNTKGYGFLKTESGQEYFVHYSAIDMDGYKSLREGDRVSFELVEGTNGRMQAEQVRLLK
jgi:CspA family cold shock protein